MAKTKTDKETNQDFYQESLIFDAQVKARIKTSLTAKYYPKNYEVNTSPSLTIPDQAMSLKTILDRYAKGLPITSSTQQPINQEFGGEGIDLRKLDLAEREELLTTLKGKIQEYQEKQSQPKPVEPVEALITP